jgi:pilus assembly protein FimV
MAVQRDKVIASAEKLVARGKIEPAIKEYERLLDDNPNDVNTLNRIGDLWVRINRTDEAVKVFSKIAEHYSKDGFFLKAIAIYKKINKLDPSKLEIYARLADLYAKQGLAMEAKSQYQVLADYYLKHGEPGSALGIYKKISELDPNSINVHVKLADLYAQSNQPAEALKEYDRVGRMLLKRGMLDEAVQVFRKALKNDPKNTDLVDSLVTALLEAKDYENARQIVETALEANRDHPRLLAMLGRIQVGRGDLQSARVTLERALAADPAETAVREALAELYLRQDAPDRALEMMVPLVEKALSRGERHGAIEMLNRVLRVDSGHIPTLERLVATYHRLNEETNVLAAMNSLAEAHVSKMRFDDAAKVLEKLIQREPQNSQHRTKLQFVKSQSGGVDTMPVKPKEPETNLPPMEIEEPAPSFDLSEEPDTIPIGLDEGSVEIDLSMPADLPEIAPVRSTPVPPPPPTHLMSAVELAAESLESESDLDFITEHLTEAEVFAKYGLAEKAAEHLRAVIERAPGHLIAHERLLRILLEEGDEAGALSIARSYVAALEEKGDTATIAAVTNDLLSRGMTLEAPRPSAARTPTVERPLPPPAPEPEETISFEDFGAGESEITLDLDSAEPGIELEIEEEVPVPEEAVEELSLDSVEDVPAGPVEGVAAFDDSIEEIEAPIELGQPVEIEAPIELGQPEDILPLEELTGEEISLDEEIPALEFGSGNETGDAFELPVEPALPVESADEPFFGVEGLGQPAPASDDDAPLDLGGALELEEEEPLDLGEEIEAEPIPLEELGEIDFYLDQELLDEAASRLETLAARYPGDPNVASRQTRLDAALAARAAENAAKAPVAPPVLSRDEIETELLSAIPDDDEEVAIPAPPAAVKPAPAPAISASIVQEENLFADEDSFFDLAAELESELAEDEEPIALAEEEQSLEEIFKEFKKGVEQQLDSEDYDTHYNLGIAYKEMGLIDEAIGEFQLASKDPKRAVECASMLGLCFLEKGMPQLAIKWYRKGLEIPEISEEEHTGLLYDLASAYQEVGDTGNAQKAFLEVYGMNTNYRDVVARIKQLEDARS